MLQMVAEYKITVTTNPFFGLEELPALIELAESGKMKGKGVVGVDAEEIAKVKEGKTASLA